MLLRLIYISIYIYLYTHRDTDICIYLYLSIHTQRQTQHIYISEAIGPSVTNDEATDLCKKGVIVLVTP